MRLPTLAELSYVYCLALCLGWCVLALAIGYWAFGYGPILIG